MNFQDSYRSGRSHGLFGKSRKAKQGFYNLASAVRNAPLVTGVRLPDDETDVVVHRGGRFINNMYVPDPSHSSEESVRGLVPEEVVVTAEFGPAGVARSGRSYQSLDQVGFSDVDQPGFLLTPQFDFTGIWSVRIHFFSVATF